MSNNIVKIYLAKYKLIFYYYVLFLINYKFILLILKRKLHESFLARIIDDTISFRISNHMRVYQDVVVGIRGRKVQLMYQQREKFSNVDSLMTSSAKHHWQAK